MDADVLIVGYGPVGQLLALRLGQAGHRVIVVERWPTLFHSPRAVHYDHEIARIFQSVGLGRQMQAISHTADVVKFTGAQGQLLFEENVGGPSQSGWPFANGFAQPELEAVLDAGVGMLPNVTVLRGWEAYAVIQDAAGVDLSVRSGAPRAHGWVPDGKTKTLRAQFVVGTDGANSFIRGQLETGFTDLGFAYDWLVVNVKWKPGHAQDFGIQNMCDPKRPTSVVPGGPGRRRWEFMLVPGDVHADMGKAETSWKLLEPWDVTPENAILERHAIYTFRAAWANDWRHGRLLVAGDAAHLMPPFMGQGMCSGMRDAMTLSWQLGMVLAGTQPPAFLDNYTQERLAHVQQFIHGSVRAGHMVCVVDPEAAARRDAGILASSAARGHAPPRPPPSRLGAGVTMDGNAHAGLLAYQGIVEKDGRSGLFDDVVGGGFSLIGVDDDPAVHLDEENLRFLQTIGAHVVHVSQDAPVRDVAAGYATWFDRHGISAMLSRPDFYQYAATDAPARDLNAIVDSLRQKLGGATKRIAMLDGVSQTA